MASIVDYPDFNVGEDCEALHGAMEGLGTNEDLITGIITNRSNAQRQEIKASYAQMFGSDLVEDLKGELGGHYEDLVLPMFQTPDEYAASELRNALDGAGTRESALIEILCTRTNEQIQSVKDAYTALYDRDLLEDLENDTSGHFGKLMYSLAQGNRSDDFDADIAKEDAEALMAAGEADWGTDESRFNVILASRSHEQLCLTFENYYELTDNSIEQVIESEMSGDVQEGMVAIVSAVRSLSGYFAERLYKSMRGAGTDDRTLIRVMVSRCEVDMLDIKEIFAARYDQTLEDFIEEDCSGDYKKCLLLLAIGNQ